MKGRLTRRDFLYRSALTAAGAALAACAPTAVPGPEGSPAAPPQTVPAAQPADTLEPTAVQAVGYGEAPALAELVASGQLPPVEERLPENPLVLEPIHRIGTYGGTIRTFSSDLGNALQLWMYGASPMRWADDAQRIVPGHCESWSTNDDNSEWTLSFRKGLKWSDGTPCTVDDVIFWWDDMVRNPNHGEVPPDFGSAGGQLAEFVKVDDYTLLIRYAAPAPLTAQRLCLNCKAGLGPWWIAPRHYLEQFHPTYNSEHSNFSLFDEKILWRQNPECPTLAAWVCESFQPGASRSWTRNPYYYCVDTEGNQLPYIDDIDEIMVEDVEVQKLTVIQGGVDFVQNHGFWLSDISTLMDQQDAGGYEVLLWDSGSGTGQMYFWNHDVEDEGLRALYRNPKFKRALSYAIDRPTIQRVVYYNTGWPTTGSMSPKAAEFNSSEEAQEVYRRIRDAYVEYDPERAMALLDEIGMVDADGDGWREMPDGSKYELRVDLQANAGTECMQVLQIVSENWGAVGLNVIINQIPPAEFGPAWRNGTLQLRANWEIGGVVELWQYPGWMVPAESERWAPLCGQRLAVRGTELATSEKDVSPWQRKPPRFSDDERDLIGEAVWRLQELFLAADSEVDALKRHALAWEAVQIHIDEGPFMLGTVANYPRIVIASKELVNVPRKEELFLGGWINPWNVCYPAITNPETYCFS